MQFICNFMLSYLYLTRYTLIYTPALNVTRNNLPVVSNNHKLHAKFHSGILRIIEYYGLMSPFLKEFVLNILIIHWEKLLDSDWLRHCEFISNLRANSVIRGKLQISRAKSAIHSKCKYKNELTINN